MPRGYRCIILALVGWLVLAASPPQQQRSQPQPHADQAIANALNRIATAAERNDEPASYTADCEQGRDNRRSDLCAQWKAADSASEAAAWAGWTWWLGLGGVGIGIGTLGAAIAAAYFASEAARHTKAGAEAAHDANRPWLTVSAYPNFVSTEGNPTFSLMLTIKNIGRAPAQNVRYEAEVIEGGKYGGDHEFFHDPHKGKHWPRPNRAVLPNGEFTDQELVFTTWEALQREGNVALIGVNVTYTLPDGAPAQTSVSYRVGVVQRDPERLGDIRPDSGSHEGTLRAIPAWFEKYS